MTILLVRLLNSFIKFLNRVTNRVKRSVSIVLLMVFLFNVGGYYIVFWGLRQQNSIELTARLDANQYTAEETIELKIPVTLPYPIQQQDFERVDGKFEHNGEHYKLVKHKLLNDTLYIVCIKDQEDKRLVKTMTEYVKLSNDLPANSDKAANFLGKLLKDFESADDVAFTGTDGWSLQLSFISKTYLTIIREKNIISPPPKV